MAKKKKHWSKQKVKGKATSRVVGTATGVIAGAYGAVSDAVKGARKSGGAASPFLHWTTKSYDRAKKGK